jgi:hypothetical protein
VIVFEIFRWNGDCTFYVAVKIGGDSKKMMGLAAISFDKAFSDHFGTILNKSIDLHLWTLHHHVDVPNFGDLRPGLRSCVSIFCSYL